MEKWGIVGAVLLASSGQRPGIHHTRYKTAPCNRDLSSEMAIIPRLRNLGTKPLTSLPGNWLVQKIPKAKWGTRAAEK